MSRHGVVVLILLFCVSSPRASDASSCSFANKNFGNCIDLYASPTGNGTYPCPFDAPCAIDSAVSKSNINDKLLLLDGEYPSSLVLTLGHSIEISAISTAVLPTIMISSLEWENMVVTFTNITFVDSELSFTANAALNCFNCTFTTTRSLQVGSFLAIQGNANFDRSTFRNARINSFGGVVHIRRPPAGDGPHVTFKKCQFIENRLLQNGSSQYGRNGGAVNYDDGACSVANSIICNTTASLHFMECSFLRNGIEIYSPPRSDQAPQYPIMAAGGALYVRAIAPINVSVVSSVFENNGISAIQPSWGGSVEGGAAAIFLESPESFLHISNTSFFSNVLQAGSFDLQIDSAIGGYAYGGALSIVTHSVCTISNCVFQANSAIGGTGSAQSGRVMGGALTYRALSSASSSSPKDHGMSIVDSRFSENTVAASPSPTFVAGGSAAGGAIAVLLRSTANMHNISIQNSVFELNSVAGIASQDATGGAVSIVQESRSPTALLFETTRWTANSVSFIRTQSESDHMVLGGAVSIWSSRSLTPAPIFRQCVFHRNEAVGSACQRFGPCVGSRAAGGAIAVVRQGFSQSPSADFSIDSCEFVSNRAISRTEGNQQRKAAHGGALFFSSQSSAPTVQSSSFINNAVECRGRSLETPTSTTDDDKFCDSGAAAFRGGATIIGCLFRNNSVVTYSIVSTSEVPSHQSVGGALTVESKLRLVGTTFDSNFLRAVECHGGAISTTAPDISLEGVRFLHQRQECSSPSSSGGAMDVTVSPVSAIFRGVVFRNNSIVNFNTWGNVGLGGSLHAIVNLYWNFSDIIFDSSHAGQGGALSLIFDASLPTFRNVAIVNCSAAERGGAVTSQASSDIELSVVRFLNDSKVFKFKNNTAPFAPDQSSTKYRLQLLQRPPTNVWPGQEFSMSAALLDIFNQTIYDPKIKVELSAITTAVNWRWKPWRDASDGAAIREQGSSGIFLFAAVEVTIPPGEVLRFSFAANGVDKSIRQAPLLANPILVTECPPGYLRSDSVEAIVCKKCPLFTYNMDGNSTCRPCPSADEHSSAPQSSTELCMEEPSIDNSFGKPENYESQFMWTIARGYYPEPSFSRPEKLLRCPNPEACLQYNCTMRYEENSWELECGKCESSHNASEPTSFSNCLCEEGYKGRLCSECLCDSTSECFFSYDTEAHECHRCKTYSTSILISAVVILQVTMIFFLLFRRSAATLFLAEFVLVVILMLLGIGEWWLFNFISLMALLFLLSAAENRKEERHHSDTSGHSEEHEMAAKMTGIIKVLLSFVQTLPSIVPQAAWPSWVAKAIELLNVINFRLSGLECLSPTLFSTPAGRFMVVMLLPVALALFLSFAVVVSALIRFSGIVSRIQIRLCGKKDEDMDIAWQSDSTASQDEDEDPIINAGLRGRKQEPPASLFEQVVPRLQYAILFILFVGHFELSNVILGALRPCIDDHMHNYPFLRCSLSLDERYKAIYIAALFFLVLYFFGIPALFGALLVRHRNRIRDGAEDADSRIGFLYETFRREYYWFEMVWIGRRAVISLAITFLPPFGVQTAALVLILLGSLGIQKRAMPFSTNVVNNLELISTAAILYTYVVGTELASSAFHSFAWLKESLQTSLWLLNAFIVLLLVFFLLQPSLTRGFHRARKLFKRCCGSSRGDYALLNQED